MNLSRLHLAAAFLAAQAASLTPRLVIVRARVHDVLGASLALRNRWIQGIIDEAGAGALLELWNGARPATGGTPAGTKLATLVGGSVIGTVNAGGLDFTETNFTQTASTHVNGTPAWFRIKKADGTHVVDGSFGGVDGTYAGNVVTGTAITFNPSVVTAPNA